MTCIRASSMGKFEKLKKKKVVKSPKGELFITILLQCMMRWT